MPHFSGLLDFALSLECLVLAVACIRLRNDFLFAGMLWTAAAACAGGFNLGGWPGASETHRWLTAAASGPGMLSVGLGLLAALWGPFATARWLSPALAIGGAGVVHQLRQAGQLEPAGTLMGCVALVALLVLTVQAMRENRWLAAVAAPAAVMLLLFVAFGAGRIPLAADGPLQTVDLVHLALMACYLLIWLAAREMTRLTHA